MPEPARAPSFVVVIGDQDRDVLDALKDRRESIQSHIVEAHGPEDAVARVLAAQPDLAAVPEDPQGQSHFAICQQIRQRNPRITTLVLRERLSEIPPSHPAIDDYVALGDSGEMMARINVLLSLKAYNARASHIRTRILEAFGAFELSPELLAEGRLVPPSKVSYRAVVDVDLIREQQAALSRFGDTAFACFLYASEPACVCSSGRAGCLRGFCPVAHALAGAPRFAEATESCSRSAWVLARDAMLAAEVRPAQCPGGYQLAAFPVWLRFRSVRYPLLAVCVALPAPVDTERLARLAAQAGADPAALQREVARHPLPQLSKVHLDAMMRLEENMAEALSRQVSQQYATAFNVLVEAVERHEGQRAAARRSRQLQRANERLRELNHLKSEFLANVSHELKTPMTSIIGFASLLLRGGAGAISDKAEHYLNRVLGNARSLHEAINDILEVAQLDSHDVVLSPASFELEPLLGECLEEIRPEAAEKPLALRCEVAPGIPGLNTDRERLRQVVMSLLSNAVKFTVRGEVRVAASPAPAAETPRVAIAVTDTGVGLATEAMPHLFEEFRQVDGSSTRRHGGAGLGLSLVKKLTRLLGGEVAVESRVDVGSTFAVTIPTDWPAFQAHRKELRERVLQGEPDPKDRSGPILLAVMDDPQTVLDLRGWCEPHGYRVASSFDTEAAIERTRSLIPLAVLVDAMATGHEVWHLADELRGDPRTTDVPLIVVSGLGGRDLAEAVGASDWLPGPVSPDALLNAVDRLRPAEAGAVLLLVGDSGRRDGLRRAFREAGLQVTACATLTEASHYASSRFDAVVVDPEAEGEGELTAFGSLRAGPWSMAPVVAYVGDTFPAEARARLATGAAAVVEQTEAGPMEAVQAVVRLVQAARREPTSD